MLQCCSAAREKVVGWYHTGPKLHQSDVAINELIRRYCPNSVLVIIDAKPKDLGLPTEAYRAVEEVHDVSLHISYCYPRVSPCSNELVHQLNTSCISVYHSFEWRHYLWR